MSRRHRTFDGSEGGFAEAVKSRRKGRFDDEQPRTRNPGRIDPGAEQPPAKKKIKKEATVNVQAHATQPAATPRHFTSFRSLKEDQFESCPLCGFRKAKEIPIRLRDGSTGKTRPLVCKGCSDRYHQYGAEVATQLANGETVIVLTRHQWILSQLDLARFAQQLGEACHEKERLGKIVADKLATHGQLPREVFIPLRDKYQEETGASVSYGNWRRLQARLEAAKEVRPQVEKMVAEEAAKLAAPAPVATTT